MPVGFYVEWALQMLTYLTSDSLLHLLLLILTAVLSLGQREHLQVSSRPISLAGQALYH